MKIIFSIIALGALALIIKKFGFKNIVKTIEEKINPDIEQAAAQLNTPDTTTGQPLQTTSDKQAAQTTQTVSNTQTTQGNNTQATQAESNTQTVNENPAPVETLELPDHVKEFITRLQFKNARLYSADSDDIVNVQDSSNNTFPTNTSTLAHDNTSEEEENEEEESGENYSNDNYNGGENSGGGGSAGNTPNLPVMPPLTPEQIATIGALPATGILSNILANPIHVATLTKGGIHLSLPPIYPITPNLGGVVHLNTGAGASARSMGRRTNFKARRY